MESSDLDTTPKPIHLVFKLKLIDEKEGQELKNRLDQIKSKAVQSGGTEVEGVHPLFKFIMYSW